MKKLLLFFALFIGFQSVNAQLPFYQFMFDIYDNGERIADSSRFKISLNIFDRKDPGKLFISYVMVPGDTAKNFGYDYNKIHGGDFFDNRIAELIIVKEQSDTMKIIFVNPNASPWSALGIDKIDFKKGIFKITENEWPVNKRYRPLNYRYFPFLDENFNWENVKTE